MIDELRGYAILHLKRCLCALGVHETELVREGEMGEYYTERCKCCGLKFSRSPRPPTWPPIISCETDCRVPMHGPAGPKGGTDG